MQIVNILEDEHSDVNLTLEPVIQHEEHAQTHFAEALKRSTR
jgi:hypothetical protein